MASRDWWSIVTDWCGTPRPSESDESSGQRQSADRWKTFAKIVGIIVVVLILLWFVADLAGGAAYAYYYFNFFNTLTGEGGINRWLAGAISICFASAMALGASLVVSIKGRRRLVGTGVLVVTSILFHGLMYACTRDAVPTRWYAKNGAGEIEIYEKRSHPITGDFLKPVTLEVWRQYQEQERQKQEQAQMKAVQDQKRAKADAAEREKQTKVEAERRFRDLNSDQDVISSAVTSAETIVLAVKSDPAQSQEIEGRLAKFLRDKGKRPVTGAFKTEFYRRGYFDQVWRGDRSILQRLHLFDRGPLCVLLCKPEFSPGERQTLTESYQFRVRLHSCW